MQRGVLGRCGVVLGKAGLYGRDVGVVDGGSAGVGGGGFGVRLAAELR